VVINASELKRVLAVAENIISISIEEALNHFPINEKQGEFISLI